LEPMQRSEPYELNRIGTELIVLIFAVCLVFLVLKFPLSLYFE
jgi:hypothetical protein